MTANAINFLRAFFSGIWHVMTSFYIPGTNVTPAAMFLGILGVTVIWKFFRRILFDDNSTDENK